MATILFGDLVNGASIDFDPLADLLVLDSPATAASAVRLGFDAAGGNVSLAAGGRLVHLLGPNVRQLTSASITFADGSLLVVGDETAGTASDDLPNSLDGGSRGDLLVGLGGADTMAGGAGDDAYLVDDAGDSVVELPGAGSDTVTSGVSFTLPGDVEHLVLVGTAIGATGNALANSLTGNSRHNVLNGGGGADQMAGGAGNDTYLVDSPGDVVTEALSAGIDQVRSSVSFTLGPNVEHLTLLGAAAVDATGNALDNLIEGNAGDNVLVGGAGVDTVSYRSAAAGVVVNLDATLDTLGAGTDTILEVENIAGSSFDDTLTGNGGNNEIEGGPGDDLIDGGAGEDRASYATATAAVTVNLGVTAPQNTRGAGLDTLLNMEKVAGSPFDDRLIGDAGANVLDGRAGADTLSGGRGDDVYFVDSDADVVIEARAAGHDTVHSSVSYTLGPNQEDLALIALARAGSGNELSNVVGGNSADNSLSGGPGIDTLTYFFVPVAIQGDLATGIVTGVGPGVGTDVVSEFENLTGSDFDDVLSGDAGANVLDGGRGVDTMAGGAGDDTYLVDSGGDVVTELAGAGIDTVQSRVAYTLGTDLENLLLVRGAIRGVGNVLDNTIAGNAGNNFLDGAAGTDTVSYAGALAGVAVSLALSAQQDTGGAGLDTLRGFENLTGSGFDDTLGGNAAANLINGGAGADTMAGGGGSDTYIVASAGDRVSEAPGAGIDTVRSAVAFTLGANVETLILTGAGAIGGTGNALANTLRGNAAANGLSGGPGSDTLAGGAGADTLVGGAGGDTLTGGAGVDVFVFNSKAGADAVTDFETGADRLRFSQAAIRAGDGDALVEGAVMVSGPGGFAATAELVIVTGAVVGSLDAAGAAAAIGSATAAYSAGAAALFAVSNFTQTGIFQFLSGAADASVSAGELTLIATIGNTATTALRDYAFTV
jgi:Ca2+-binding RTX toxin-like protein